MSQSLNKAMSEWRQRHSERQKGHPQSCRLILRPRDPRTGVNCTLIPHPPSYPRPPPPPLPDSLQEPDQESTSISLSDIDTLIQDAASRVQCTTPQRRGKKRKRLSESSECRFGQSLRAWPGETFRAWECHSDVRQPRLPPGIWHLASSSHVGDELSESSDTHSDDKQRPGETLDAYERRVSFPPGVH